MNNFFFQNSVLIYNKNWLSDSQKLNNSQHDLFQILMTPGSSKWKEIHFE